MSYCVKKRDCDAWIHYNPHTKEYFTADTRLGACVWNNLEFVKGFINLITFFVKMSMKEGEFWVDTKSFHRYLDYSGAGPPSSSSERVVSFLDVFGTMTNLSS